MVSNNVERIVHRQAANAVSRLLKADEFKKGGISIKSLTLAPSVRAKKATHALTCETLRYLPIIKEVIDSVGIFKSKQTYQKELVFVLVYDLLFGKSFSPSGGVERLILNHKTTLKAALARLLIKKKVSSPLELLPSTSRHTERMVPRYVRVNTLHLSVDEAIEKLRSILPPEKIIQDDTVPTLLSLPLQLELHDFELVKKGSLILQGKSSCMPALALDPQPGWLVVDACAAPGNKTTHLSALMNAEGKIIACELNKERCKILKNTVSSASAKNVEVLNEDFLKLDPSSARLENVKAILLDPSCSGSGTSIKQLHHLLPSSHSTVGSSHPNDVQTDSECYSEENIQERLQKLSNFQKLMLTHAFKFQSVERIVYSTCSIYEEENEKVVESVLPFASSQGFILSKAIPSWPHRGNPIFPESDKLLRVDAHRDLTDGFFIALFTKHGEEAKGKRKRESEEQEEKKEEKKAGTEDAKRVSKAKKGSVNNKGLNERRERLHEPNPLNNIDNRVGVEDLIEQTERKANQKKNAKRKTQRKMKKQSQETK